MHEMSIVQALIDQVGSELEKAGQRVPGAPGLWSPLPSGEAGLQRYLQDIRQFPMLQPDEEYMLAKRWKEHEDPEAARRLVADACYIALRVAGWLAVTSLAASWPMSLKTFCIRSLLPTMPSS